MTDAEIEKLKDELAQTEDAFNEIYKINGAYEKKIDTIKAEAIKEYKEKVKAILMDKGIYPVVVKNALNEAKKELVGDLNGNSTRI